MNVRPQIELQLAEERPMDRIDRQVPRGILSVCGLMRAVPHLAREFSVTVPDEFWAMDATDDGYDVGVIACPCGETPRVEVGRVIECACERFYFFTGTGVLVAGSPAST